MNRALTYFGGKKAYLIPFAVLLGIFSLSQLLIVCSNIISSWSPIEILWNLFDMAFVVILLLSIISLWLCFIRKAFVVITSLLILISLVNIGMQIYIDIIYGFDVNVIVVSIISELLYCAPYILAVILLRLKADNKINIKPYMAILFIPMSGIISFIMEMIQYSDSEVMGLYVARGIILDLIPRFCMIGVFIFLWLPLVKLAICPKCGHRSTKTSGFCGICGSPINQIK